MTAVAQHEGQTRRFDTPNFLWHFGAVVGIFAVGFLAEGYERYGGGWLVAISAAFCLAYAAGSALLLRRGWHAPAGVLATLAVATIPLLVYALEKLAGLWPDDAPQTYVFHDEIHGAWIAMEMVTIVVGVVVVALVRFPLVLAPVCFVAWYLSMDLAPALFGDDAANGRRALVSALVGAVLVAVGLALDARRLRRFAFWPHVFGLASILGATCWLTYDHNVTLVWVAVTALSLVTIFAAIPLERTTYAVFGGLGLLSTLCYWSYRAFWDSAVFPAALAVVGLLFVGLGIVWQARGASWRSGFAARLGRT